MRLLVTGGSGFLGGYVLAEAARRGHSCVALARKPPAAAQGGGRRAGAGRSLTGDLDDGAALTAVFASAGCDALVNLASLGFGHAPGIVRAAVRSGLDRRRCSSRPHARSPRRPAAPSKTVRLAAEEEIRRSGLDWTILRPTMIYGAAGDRNLSRLLALLARMRGAPVPPVLPVPGGGHLAATARPCGGRGRLRGGGGGGTPGDGGLAVRRGRAVSADVRRAAARVGSGCRRPDSSPAGADGAGDRAYAWLRAGRPPAQDPRRAVAAASRGQGVPDRGRRP